MVQELAIADNSPTTNNTQPPPQPAANAVLQDNVQFNMLRLLREISTERRGEQGGRGRVSGGNSGRGYGCGYGE